MENTSGFYKIQIDNTNKILLYGPNCVLNSEYELLKQNHLNYEYPVDGWYWFDSEEEARVFFDAPKSVEENNI